MVAAVAPFAFQRRAEDVRPINLLVNDASLGFGWWNLGDWLQERFQWRVRWPDIDSWLVVTVACASIGKLVR